MGEFSAPSSTAAMLLMGGQRGFSWRTEKSCTPQDTKAFFIPPSDVVGPRDMAQSPANSTVSRNEAHLPVWSP